ncbi:MAG: hypothetical protein A2600_07765 [Candidatus Lambdaproteobacteria bacterium RIFOXYD1_FULL_56_27]|uniref:TIGR00374 family protein n=1 Tax=Candidatus Lambdaproteobacteria bacterium RIFOXYD2_FULL_56_26 TaxID=1817773 RepID=A0A1F6GNK6_9PROT|nr:MAG: hypothetical protein A2557_05990 [Candidatus Lambdaproteobacteria bacterium RIFOXYD2_FULL_56_26]OGG99855.1 MAG: hypothetical protein A2426_09720 [Candidatus Lambdaproteobacteria bacterium RIFOXYC1_FULL_56_13]OGH09670.1 MAG: hypothetical protein A2600_07765 [Candidatus Lambdaproteobacteria bacterium RIFOXYD1_FULL_56_27]
MNLKTWAIRAVKALLVGGILVYLVESERLDLKSMGLLFSEPWTMLAVALLILFGANGLVALRWRVLMSIHPGAPSLTRLFNIQWIGQFFAAVLPGTVSTDGVKAFYIIKESKGILSKTPILSVLIIDRLAGLFGLVVLSVLGLVVLGKTSHSSGLLELFVFGLFAGMSLFFMLLLLPIPEHKDPILKLFPKLPKGELLEKIYRAFVSFRSHRFYLLVGIFISVFIQLLLVVCFYLLGPLVCNCSPDPFVLAFITPLGELSTVVPLGPAGIGVGHVAWAYLWAEQGMKGGADVFNLFTIMRILAGLMGGIPYLLYKKRDGAPPSLDDESAP